MLKIRLLSATVAALMSLVVTLVLGIVAPVSMWLLIAVMAALWLTLNRAWYGFLRTDT